MQQLLLSSIVGKRLISTLRDERRIPAWDYLRGFAIITVLAAHFGWFDWGGIGVDCFFVLSGYLVSGKAIEAYRQDFKMDWRAFWIKRLTKILPSYFFFIIIGYLLGQWLIIPIRKEAVFEFSEIWEYLLFLRNYAGPPARDAFEHTWSLCAEEHFYLLFGIGTFLLLQMRTRGEAWLWAFAWAWILAGLGFKCIGILWELGEWPSYTHNRLDAFGWGLLARLIFLRWRPTFSYWQRFLLILLSIVLLLIAVLYYPDYDPHALLRRAIVPFAIVVLMLGVKHITYIWGGLALRLLAYYSYNIYLWHYFWLIPISYYAGDTAWLKALYLILLTAVSAFLCTRFIEEPFLELRKKYLVAK
ncbi:MAG: acyltransferase [Bernardetiaceae bacterium]|nr:acyltransferase [Bernardetiaceae bacterium]